MFGLRGAERQRATKRIEELMAGNKLMVADHSGLAIAMHYPKIVRSMGMDPRQWDEGITVTEDSLLEGFRTFVMGFTVVLRRGIAELVGARREALRIYHLLAAAWVPYAGSGRAATLVHEWVVEIWGSDACQLMAHLAAYEYGRLHDVFKSMATQQDTFLAYAPAPLLLEVYGDAPKVLQLFVAQQSAHHSCIRAGRADHDVAIHFMAVAGAMCIPTS